MSKHGEVIKKMNLESGSVVTILEGKAPEMHNLQTVNLSGNIQSARRFLEARDEEFDKKKAHCIVSLDDGTVDLVVNEQDACDTYTIKGAVEISKLFKELGINTSKRYSAIELANKFRLLRAIFESHDDHAEICATLKNLKAKINRNLEQNKQDNGNARFLFEQEVSSNMPESFNLVLPLVKGGEKENIEVQVILEADGMDIKCFLVSVDGQEKIDHAFEKLVRDEASVIEKSVLVIYK